MRVLGGVLALTITTALLAGCVADRLTAADALPGALACPVAGGAACEQGLSGPRVNEFSAAANPLDHMNAIITANDYGGQDNEQLRRVNFVWGSWWTTKDGGASWTRQTFGGRLPDTDSSLSGRGFVGDLVVTFAADGTAYVAGMAYTSAQGVAYRNAVWVARSDDGGDTFGEPVLLATTKDDVHFNDKPAIAVDSAGRVHVAWMFFRGNGPLQESGTLYAKSEDGGATWTDELRISVDDFSVSPTVAIGPDDSVNVAWRRYVPESAVSFARSTDAGESFTEPVVVREMEEDGWNLPNTSYRAPSLPTMVATADGTLLMTLADKLENDSSDVFLYRSRDAGATWTASRLNTDATANAQFLPTLAVAPDGVRVVASWLDRRDDPEDRAYLLYAAESRDGGATWTPERAVATNASVDPNPPPEPPVARVPVLGLGVGGGGPTTFIGDYIGTAISGDRVYYSWPDLREDGVPHLWAAARAIALA